MEQQNKITFKIKLNQDRRLEHKHIHWTILYQTVEMSLKLHLPTATHRVMRNYLATRFYSSSHVHNTEHYQHVRHPVSRSVVIFLLNNKCWAPPSFIPTVHFSQGPYLWLWWRAAPPGVVLASWRGFYPGSVTAPPPLRWRTCCRACSTYSCPHRPRRCPRKKQDSNMSNA